MDSGIVNEKDDVRKRNIRNSPKKNGSSDIDSIPYLKELGVEIVDETQAIQFKDNNFKTVHRWTPYIQGFSASFVQRMIDDYGSFYKEPKVLDPFAGSGTVIIQAKMNGLYAFGNEINPWMTDIANTKANALKIDVEKLENFIKNIELDRMASCPTFLKNEKHFEEDVLNELRKLKYYINNNKITNGDTHTQNAIKLAFSSILIPLSNLKRSPCLGYVKNKSISVSSVKEVFISKVNEIIEDVQKLRLEIRDFKDDKSMIELSSSATHNYNQKFDLVITSPPYMNGMDYAINYKIEMSWLDYVSDHKELKEIKEQMVVCDNVSKKFVKNFDSTENKYTNEWIENIKKNINSNIERRGSYRRMDMANIVHKYFDDMYQIMKNVVPVINEKGRFILVVGDSLIVDEYVPTDLLLARIGVELGMKIESIVKARNRRSGQIRSYVLRETIITLVK